MKKTCGISYQSGDKIILNNEIRKYLSSENKDTESFGTWLTNKGFKATVVKTENSTEEYKASMDLFMEDFNSLIGKYAAKINAGGVKNATLADLKELQEYVSNEFLIEIDESQKIKVLEDEDQETRTDSAIHDKAVNDLNEHYKDLYGNGSYNIISSIEEKFTDWVMFAAYRNSNDGTIVARDNTILNHNMQNIKNIFYKLMVSFLKQEMPSDSKILNLPDFMFDDTGKFIGPKYYLAQDIFYNYVKKLNNFQTDINDALRKLNNNEDRKNKTDLYKILVSTLIDSNEDFKKRLENKFGNTGFNSAKVSLFEGSEKSRYYKFIRRLINTKPELQTIKIGDKTVLEVLEDIETDSRNLLTASQAYTMLTHFDELLKKTFGKDFNISRGLSGIEDGDPKKYSYHHDISSQKASWQQGESVDAEKYMATLAKNILNQIHIYDYHSGKYINKRANPVSFIFALKHLTYDLLFNNIKWSGDSISNKSVQELYTNAFKIHAAPTERYYNILNALFNPTSPLIDKINKTKLLTPGDINVLYSVFKSVFDKENSESLINTETRTIAQGTGKIYLLCSEIASIADRNTIMDYLECNIGTDGTTHVKIKRKYFNNKITNVFIQDINRKVNADRTTEECANLRLKYNFKYSENVDNLEYSVQIGDELFTLTCKNAVLGGILENSANLDFSDSDLFKRLNDIDLIDFLLKYIFEKDQKETLADYNFTYSDDEKLLKSVLEFIDDHLGLGFTTNPDVMLPVLSTYKQGYVQNDDTGGKYYLEPLVALAMRAAYVNSKYEEKGDKTLKQYLTDSKNSLYLTYGNNKLKNKWFSEMFNEVKYVIANYSDGVLLQLADAKSIIAGDASKSTTKDNQGNNIPNNGVNKLGTELMYYLRKLRDSNSASNLLFVKNSSLVKSIPHDLEVTTANLDKLAVKSFTSGELFHHAMFNKFWGLYVLDGNVIILPTTYSDKTTFINYLISTNLIDAKTANDRDILKSDNYKDIIIDKYISTVGETYKEIWRDNQQKLLAVTDYYNANNGTNYDIRQLLHSINESELILLGSEVGVDFELDKDYRKLKGSDNKEYLDVNEILEYYANDLYANRDNLDKTLENLKKFFIDNLINANFLVLVLGFNLKYVDFLNPNSKVDYNNQILKIIYAVFPKFSDRSDFFKNWVDEKTGYLILGKQTNEDGTVTNIIDDKINHDYSVELNPLLDKFFYLEGLYSNNMRMSLTGSEINHPDKSQNLYNLIKKAKTLNDLKESKDLFRDSNGQLSEVIYLNIRNEILGTRSVSDLKDANNDSILRAVYENTMTSIMNTAQGTQFKRNVIIPATLLYLSGDTIDGCLAKTKCAVIYDMKAPVFNYRGESDNLKPHDGLGYINPFLCILENKALGSQAVGFTKKPIWHSFDANGCTAFLAKFATNTTTNEAMLMSQNSDFSLLKLFKKMTDLLWEGDVDLMHHYILGDMQNKSTQYWEGCILQNTKDGDDWTNSNRLFYKNEYGETIEIIGFGKSHGTYYTIEKNIKSLVDGSEKKVYHTFDENGKHIKTELGIDLNYPKELTDKRTINSLYELWESLGGLHCVDLKGNASEFVNEVVVSFMNNVGSKVEGDKSKIINQTHYVQPLKKYHIGYVLNNTAVKNGAKNINQTSAWTDDSKLTFFDADTDGLGMQMNADHEVIDSELTEFSLVITATSAYGYTPYPTEIFSSLGYAAVSSQRLLLDKAKNFLSLTDNPEKAKSEFYEAVGRILMANASIKNKENLLHIILQAVNNVFYKNSNHNDDSVKIPFSDPNIYSDFIATIASTVNKTAIKRKHPGTGAVLVGAYGSAMYFELNGLKYMSWDILKKAKLDYDNELWEILKARKEYTEEEVKGGGKIPVITYRNKKYYLNSSFRTRVELVNAMKAYKGEYELDNDRQMIRNYLKKKLNEIEVTDDYSWFMPSDIVNLIDSEGNLVGDAIKLDSLDDYYRFKSNITQSERYYNVKIKSDWKKGKFDIILNDSPNASFRIEREVLTKTDEDGKQTITPTGKYNIHFRTGNFDETTQRRVPWGSDVLFTEEQKMRLLNASLDILPLNAVVRLSPTTEEQLKTKRGGLTKGSISGYNRISTVDGFEKVGEPYEVAYFDKDNNVSVIPVNEFKKVKETSRYRYQVNVTEAHNLRPSLIRWQYADANGNLKYRNIFDFKHIREAYTNPEFKNVNYRTLILDELHRIQAGQFTDDDDVVKDIEKGTLENTAAELILSNMYKDKFGIKDESLSEILEQGEDYFLKKINKFVPPQYSGYDLAFLNEDGKNLLVTFKPVKESELIRKVEFNNNQLQTNEKGEIYLVKNNHPLYKVGAWIDDDTVTCERNGVGKLIFYDNKGNNYTEEDNMFMLDNPKDLTSVKRKVMYVNQYRVMDKYTNDKEVYYKDNVLYQLAPIDTFIKVFNNGKEISSDDPNFPLLMKDAQKQRAKILLNMFQSGSYRNIHLNRYGKYSDKDIKKLRTACSFIDSNNYIDQAVKDLLNAQFDAIDTDDDSVVLDEKGKKAKLTEEQIKKRKEVRAENRKQNKLKLLLLEKEFNKKLAHKTWISFLDSQNFISSRIPAQTLLSFMSMRNVGWTLNDKNMAYVSHFQFYLQGSDLDIDKAYIMGQSYDSNGGYIGWSTLFDYSTSESFEKSKQIPVPKKIKVNLTEDGDVDITKAVNKYQSSNDLLDLVEIIRSVESNVNVTDEDKEVNVKYDGSDKEFAQEVIDKINRHEFTPIPHNLSEAIYKNSASANIYAVAHDIRNRDQAYTAVTMADLLKAANNSPKNGLVKTLNMLNPFTKYIMQYLNLVGKNVISIAANGEKVWFNMFYYWNEMLKKGRGNELKFNVKFNRIKGRAKKNLENTTIDHLPDLNWKDERIRKELMNTFGVTDDEFKYSYVDLKISLLLSAATDNAKELILARINSGTNFARMYIFGFIMGFDVDDLVSFMTSDVSEFIDSQANRNVFSNNSTFKNASMAINLAQGIVGHSKFLHGSYYEYDPDTDESYTTAKSTYVANRVLEYVGEDKIKNWIAEHDGVNVDDINSVPLSKAMRAAINLALSDTNINLREIEVNDIEMNLYLNYCQNLIKKLRQTYDKYSTVQEFYEDIAEFKKLYDLSSELSDFATAFLSLNQGIPTDIVGIVNKLNKMLRIVTSRENKLGIVAADIFKNSNVVNDDVELDNEMFEDNRKNKPKKEKSDEIIMKNRSELVLKLKENNPNKEITEKTFDEYEDIINKFDILKYLSDKSYRKHVADYYDLIMGTTNIFKMMEVLPLYSAILDLFNSVVASNEFAQKTRFIFKSIRKNNLNLTEENFRKISSFYDKYKIILFANHLMTDGSEKSGPIPFHKYVMGFNKYYLSITTDYADLSSIDGIMTFKHFVENEFLKYLLDNYGSNPLVKHLKVTANDHGSVLATDIDLMNPDISNISKYGYGEILQGIAQFEGIKYDKSNYTIADILLLYNLLVNYNQYGSDRLTTIFLKTSGLDNILNKYLKFVGDGDMSFEDNFDYSNNDYLINIAPTISSFSERFATEKFIKVKDPIQGYIVKVKYGNNDYLEYTNYLPNKFDDETNDEKLLRMKNFYENSPFEFPEMLKLFILHTAIDYDGNFDDFDDAQKQEILDTIKTILTNYSTNSKAYVFIQC